MYDKNIRRLTLRCKHAAHHPCPRGQASAGHLLAGKLAVWARSQPQPGNGADADRKRFPARLYGQWCDLNMGFPKDLNQPLWASEYLSLHDFNIDKDGNGALTGVANLERDGHEQQRFYQYTTRDWGKTWGKPTPIKSPAAKLPGVSSLPRKPCLRRNCWIACGEALIKEPTPRGSAYSFAHC